MELSYDLEVMSSHHMDGSHQYKILSVPNYPKLNLLKEEKYKIQHFEHGLSIDHSFIIFIDRGIILILTCFPRGIVIMDF